MQINKIPNHYQSILKRAPLADREVVFEEMPKAIYPVGEPTLLIGRKENMLMDATFRLEEFIPEMRKPICKLLVADVGENSCTFWTTDETYRLILTKIDDGEDVQWLAAIWHDGLMSAAVILEHPEFSGLRRETIPASLFEIDEKRRALFVELGMESAPNISTAAMLAAPPLFAFEAEVLKHVGEKTYRKLKKKFMPGFLEQMADRPELFQTSMKMYRQWQDAGGGNIE